MDYKEMNTEFDVEFEECVARKVAGTTDYTELNNKPKINDVELVGNKTLDELGIQPKGDYATNESVETVNETIDTELEELVETFNRAMTHYYNKEEIDEIVGAIDKLELVVVDSLPETGESGKVYLVEESAENTVYGEFLWINGAYKKLGDTQIDLSDYALKSDIVNEIVIIPYKTVYSSEEKTQYLAKIGECFTASWEIIKPLYISISGLLLPYVGRINENTLSFGMNLTDIISGIHYVEYTMIIGENELEITSEQTTQLVDREELEGKQDTLISGENIKTINGNSILGEGNIDTGVTTLVASEENKIDFNNLTEAGFYILKNCNTNTTLNSPFTDDRTHNVPMQVKSSTDNRGNTYYEQLLDGGLTYRNYTNEWYDWGNVIDDIMAQLG